MQKQVSIVFSVLLDMLTMIAADSGLAVDAGSRTDTDTIPSNFEYTIQQ
jgi:hypothetical protein